MFVLSTRLFFFFFQAEDGIRDSSVTGVQTCALPIFIATRYSGEAGARRLREQGYAPEMIEMMKGAGTRTFKHRAGMPVLGILGKMGNTRMNGGVNALLDTWIRKVSPEQAQGGRYWSN